MKRMAGLFLSVFFLFSACGAPVATEPVPYTHSLTTIPALPSSTQSTSTAVDLKEAYGGAPFCQIAPEKARLGSFVNISAFDLPANHPISVFIYDDNRIIRLLPNTILTDGNGYVNVDIMIPGDLSTEEWKRIALIAEGMPVEASCGVWPWTESSLATYSAGLTKTPTSTPSSEQIVITATQQALHDQLDQYCEYNQAWAFRFSPNGQWTEIICGSDCIVIVRMDGTKEWRLSSESLIGPHTDHFVYVSHWSSDGAYVYVNANAHTDGYWEPFHQAIALFRLHLGSGQVSEVLKGKYYSFAFSPNDRRLAYIMTDQSPVILNIRDMQTGTEQSFQFDSKYNTGGRFVWSADSQKMVFSITQYDENLHEHVATSIVLWDKEKSDTITLLEDYHEILIPVEWLEETKIVLQVLYEDEQKYELDLRSGELRQIGP